MGEQLSVRSRSTQALCLGANCPSLRGFSGDLGGDERIGDRRHEEEQVYDLLKLSNFIFVQWLIKTSKREGHAGPKTNFTTITTLPLFFRFL